MLYELKKREYQKVTPIVKGAHFDFVIESLVAGRYPAKFYVDDIQHPNSIFVLEALSNYYFAGEEKNIEFNKSVEKLIVDSIIPEAIIHQNLYFKVYYSSNNWQSILHEVFKDRLPVIRERRIQTFEEIKIPDWKDQVLEGYHIKQIDEKLLARTYLKNVHSVIEEINSMWRSLNDFLKYGFGFCMIKEEKEVISWCTSEYVSEGKCGIGIATIEREYKNKGFATLTATAFVDYCHKNHISPYWESWKENSPSLRVAEKVGFQKKMDFSVLFGKYDESIC
ncbi:MAG: GNAT family N-acetyltransferase [Promethearchaeota archaeon]